MKIVIAILTIISVPFVGVAAADDDPSHYAGCSGHGDIYTGDVTLDFGPLNGSVFSIKWNGLFFKVIGNPFGSMRFTGFQDNDLSKPKYELAVLGSNSNYAIKLGERPIQLPKLGNSENLTGRFVFDERTKRVDLDISLGEESTQVKLTCFSNAR